MHFGFCSIMGDALRKRRCIGFLVSGVLVFGLVKNA